MLKIKKLFICFFIFLLPVNLLAQDLIITNSGDSINCEITKIQAQNIHYRIDDKNKQIASTAIKKYTFNFYPFITTTVSQPTVSQQYYQSVNPDIESKYIIEYPNLRITYSGGYSYRLAPIDPNIPDDFINYMEKLKSGFHLGSDVIYFFSQAWGIGAKGGLYKASNSINNIYVEVGNGNRIYGNMSDNITISFAGATLATDLFKQNRKNRLLLSFSLGCLWYEDDMILIDMFKVKGNTFGTALNIAYDIQLSEHLSLGFMASLYAGSMSEYTISDGMTTLAVDLDAQHQENLTRFDLSVGLNILL